MKAEAAEVTIRVRQSTKDRLDSQKVADRESYDDVITRVLNNQVHEIQSRRTA